MWLLVTLWHKVTLPFESTISSMNCTISITFILPWSGVQAVERLQILKRVWWRWVEIPGRVCSALCNVHMTRSQNNDTFLFQRVLKILTACRILQISIARCQKEGVRSREFMHTHMCTVKHFLYCMVNTESVSKHRTVQYFKFNSFLMIIIKNNIINIIIMVCRNNKEAYPEPCREFTLKESFWFALTSFTPQVIMANI